MILLANFHPFRPSEPLTASSMARSGSESVKYARSWLLRRNDFAYAIFLDIL
jgi:hypothetical protein